MSVLIKGMSMPTSCANCEWSMLCKMDLGMSCYCSIVKKTEDIDIARKGRMSICPLIEVPPHGRLIDADVMIKRYEPDMNRRIYGGNFIFDLEYAPTVIPADKDGET